MKKLILAAALFSTIALTAQTPYDALNLTQSEIRGTARYTSMAGAFGALGGDVSAIKDNPAGLGIFRKSELSTTVDVLSQYSAGNWNGTQTQDDLYKMGFNNFSYIIAHPTWRKESGQEGLQYSNWSFTYNKLKDYNRRSYLKGTDFGSSLTDYMAYFAGNTPGSILNFDNYPTSSYNSPWDNLDASWLSIMGAYSGLINEYVNPTTNSTEYWSSDLNIGEKVSPSYILQESGSAGEYSLGWSGNFSSKLFVGLNLNLQSIYHQTSTLYSEAFSAGGGFKLTNSMSTSGTGVNFNVGAIYMPIDFMRVGFSYHSPTVLSLTDVGNSKLDFYARNEGYISTPDNTLDYKIVTPSQLNVSAGFIVGTKGLISAEYVLNNYTGTRFLDSNGESMDFLDENQRVREYLNDTRTIKVGGEYKVTDNFSLRAGYANTNNATVRNSPKYMLENTTRSNTEYFLNNSTNYFTGGFGYRESSWYIDFAYMKKITNDTFVPYSASVTPDHLEPVPATLVTTNNNFVVTLGLKF